MDKEQQFVGIVQECSDFVFPSVINGVVSSKISTKSCNNCLSSKEDSVKMSLKTI